ncbi:hypothetical protein EFY87_10060 [Flexivirga caeni]|uniref:Uncharacterized protein n=1 Tax=Flexivirga caeni TaxID=2294115 RepID=A0A3M9M9S6_9MICO|nr:hypothetical protein EFY87_10060 [Flexivirga caeni]
MCRRVVVWLASPQSRPCRGAVLVARLGEKGLDARQVADQTGRDTEIAVAGRHPRDIEVYRPQQDGVSTD